MHSAQVYGVVLRSRFAPLLPDVPAPTPCRSALRTVELVRGTASQFSKVRKALEGWSTGTRWFEHARLQDGSHYLRWSEFFECLVTTDGRTIISHPLNGSSEQTTQTYLLTQALAFALPRLGIEPLHATTVVIHGKAVAFLGDCGLGKSTLAAACLKEGGSLLTDDLLVLQSVGGRFLAYPGQPRIKLMPSVARWWFGSEIRSVPRNPHIAKRIIPLEAPQYTAVPVPLHRIYALRPPRRGAPARVTIRRLTRRAAWAELTGGTSNLLLQEPERLRRLFAWACRLAQRIPVKSLSYPRSLRALPEVVRAVAADVAS